MISTIQLAESVAELKALYAFRYRIYVVEMARSQKYADHEAKIIRDPLDNTAYNFIAWHNGMIAGCLRVNFARDGGLDYYRDLLRMDAVADDWRQTVSLSTRLMIAPAWRGTMLAVRLSIAAYELGLTSGIIWNFIDCNNHLVNFFGRLGWVRTHSAHHEEYGVINAMRLNLRDEGHLEICKSPFVQSLQRRLASEEDRTANRLPRFGQLARKPRGLPRHRSFAPTN